MEQENSMQFFNSFLESLQRHCQDHLLFNKFVEIGGYISVEIDNVKKERYVLSELLQSSGNVVSESFSVKAFTDFESNSTSCISLTRKNIPPQRRRSRERFGGSGFKYRKLEDHGQPRTAMDSHGQPSQRLQSQQDNRVPRSSDRSRYCQLESASWDLDTLHPSSDYCSGKTDRLQTQSTTSHSDQYSQGNDQKLESEGSSEHDSLDKFLGPNDIQETMVTFPCIEPEEEISDANLKGDANVIDVDLLNDDLDLASSDLSAPDVETFPHQEFSRDSANPLKSHAPHTTAEGEASYRYGRTNPVPSGQQRKKLSPGTIYTVRSGVNIFKKYHLSKSGIDIDLFSTPPERMNELILDYFRGAKKMNGGELSHRSLKNVQERLDMFLADGGYQYSLRKDAHFATSNDYLQQLMAERVKQPSTTYVHVTAEDIEALFNCNQIGKCNPDMLTNGMWVLNCRFFAIRRPNEHLGMKWKDITLEVDEHGKEYIARRINDSLCLKKFANVENPDQCFVSLYKQYRDKRPAEMCDGDSPFYLRINRLFSNQCWFLSEPMAWTNFSNIWRKMVVGAALPNNKKIF